MPVYLKQIKKELESGKANVGKDSKGDYKFTPPNFVSRKLSEYTNLNVTRVITDARPGLSAVSYSGLVASESTKGVKYKVTIQFHEMSFRGTPSANLYTNKHEYMSDGKKKVTYFRNPSVQNNPVMLKCQCPDFQHRFETELYEADALIGAPRKYRRKTPPWPVGNPYANTTEKLGICKHINSMLTYLREREILKER